MLAAKLGIEEMNAMDDLALISACFAPMIRAYKEAETKGEDFSESGFLTLSKGQQALFPFWAYCTHVVKSEADLFWWTAYFMARPKRWLGVLSGLRFFGDTSTLGVAEDMAAALAKRNHPRSLDRFDVAFDDLRKDAELADITASLYGRLLAGLPSTCRAIADHIRRNPLEFIA